MKPYHPARLRLKAKHIVAQLRERENDALCRDAADALERMREEMFALSNKIRYQRASLRENWQIIEQRAAYHRAWYRSPLLTSILTNRRKPTPWWRRLFVHR